MIRIIIFLLIVAVLAALAVWITDKPGSVEVSWGDWLIETSPAVLVAMAALITVFGAIVFQLLRWFWIGQREIARGRKLRRQRRGYFALTQGLVSAAAGDASGARRLARRANVLLGEPPLTLLLSAQAAQLEGEDELAKVYFEAMLERPETEFLGLRGLLVQAKKAGEKQKALSLAERAFSLRPRTPWVLKTLLELQTYSGNWSDALFTLHAAQRQKAVDKKTAVFREAGLLLQQARMVSDRGEGQEALKLAEKASSIASNFLPAIIFAVEQALMLGQISRAERMISRAWEHTPHPKLAQYFNEIHSDKDVRTRTKSFEKLASCNPEDPETKLILASAALEAQMWSAARKYLEQALKIRPNVSVFRRLAHLEEVGFKNNEAARLWLLKASEALPEPFWLCQECGTPTSDWELSCNSCGAFDCIEWGQQIGIKSERKTGEDVSPFTFEKTKNGDIG